MTRLIVSPIQVPPETLVCVDLERRVYLGLSRDGSYLHVGHPRGFEQLGEQGEVIGLETDLVCTCKGAIFQGKCYQTERAIAAEAELDAPATPDELAWARPVGAGR